MRKEYRWFLLIIEIILLTWMVWQYQDKFKQIISPTVQKFNNSKLATEVKTFNKVESIPTIVPIQTVTPTIIKKKKVITPTPDTEPWGVAKQVDEVTWTMKVGDDEKMATPQEILVALNEYRKRYNSQVLTLDSKLGGYAQSRAKYLNSIKNVDKHEGFNNYVGKEDGFNKLGFNALGENISYGYRLNGVHVIEWMYAGDKPHNDNQLNNNWNYVGIGVDGLATCLIFGTAKI